MKKNDIYSVIREVADKEGFDYCEDNKMSRAFMIDRVSGEEFVVVPFMRTNTLCIACSVFYWGTDIDEKERAWILNKMNLRENGLCFIMMPRKENDDEIEMMVKTDLLTISKSHLRKEIPLSLNRLATIREKCRKALPPYNGNSN